MFILFPWKLLFHALRLQTFIIINHLSNNNSSYSMLDTVRHLYTFNAHNKSPHFAVEKTETHRS